MLPVLISLTPFCELIEMSPKRLEVRRTRERAALDVSEALGAQNDIGSLPISPTKHGSHSRFGFDDALAMKLVLELERAGHDFTRAALFLRSAGLGGFWAHDDAVDGDYFLGFWSAPDGVRNRWFGTARDLARSAPASPHVRFALNVSSTADALRKRAQEHLELGVRGVNFYALEGADER